LADQGEIILASLDVQVDQVFEKFMVITFGDPAAITEYQGGFERP
jgi:hypothetical protein